MEVNTDTTFEEILKKNIYNEVKADGQSDKYFETIWLFWWGTMDTSVKNGIFNAVKEYTDIHKK